MEAIQIDGAEDVTFFILSAYSVKIHGPPLTGGLATHPSRVSVGEVAFCFEQFACVTLDVPFAYGSLSSY